MKKFYNIKSQNNTTGIYIYGEIIGGSDKWDESDVTFDDFRKALEINPKSLFTEYNVGILNYRMKKYEYALGLFEILLIIIIYYKT